MTDFQKQSEAKKLLRRKLKKANAIKLLAHRDTIDYLENCYNYADFYDLALNGRTGYINYSYEELLDELIEYDSNYEDGTITVEELVQNIINEYNELKALN